MQPRDIFGVILRTFGLYLLLWGIWNALAGVKFVAGSFLATFFGKGSEYGSFGYFFYGVPAMIAGLVMLRFAEGLLNFTYRKPKLPPMSPPARSEETVHPPGPE